MSNTFRNCFRKALNGIMLLGIVISTFGVNGISDVHAQVSTVITTPQKLTGMVNSVKAPVSAKIASETTFSKDVVGNIPLLMNGTNLPLNSQLGWTDLGVVNQSIRVNELQTADLSGEMYESDHLFNKLPGDIVNYYSNTNLSQLGWNWIYDAGGVTTVISVFFQSPNNFLIVQIGSCGNFQNDSANNENQASCIKVWGGFDASYKLTPTIPSSSPTSQPNTITALTFSNPLPVPTFSQNDGTWKADQLGWPDAGYPTACDPYTLGYLDSNHTGYGCWVTAYAMLYNYYQAGFTNPRTLNNELIAGKDYASNGAHCNNYMLLSANYAPSGVTWRDKTYNNCTSANCVDSANVSLIDNELNAGRPLLAQVHYSGTTPQHMVVITGHSGSTYFINDPWGGGQLTLATGALGPYVLDWIHRWNGTPNGGSLNPPTLQSPSDGQTLSSRSVHFTWQSPNSTNQNGYTFRLSTFSNPDTQPWIVDTGLGNEYASYDYTFSADGTYYWFMRTWNSSGQASSWTSHSFTITAPVGPGTPNLNSPSDGASIPNPQSVTFNWSSTGDSYSLEITGGPSAQTVSPTTNSYSVGSMWPGIYQWHVKAYRNSQWSGWSSTWTLNVPPGAPASVNVTTNSTSAVTVTWADSPGGVDGFRVYRNGSQVADVSSSTHSFQVTGLPCGDTSTYTVRGYKGSLVSADGTASGSTVTCPSLPGTFFKVAPTNSVTGVGINPTLSWGASSGATSYEYCFYTTNNSDCNGSWTGVGTNTSANLTGLSYDTTYHWQVRARNSAGTTDADYGVWWSFTIAGTKPGDFNKSTPTNLATVSTTPILGWLASPGATSYEFCYDTTNDNTCSNWTSTGTNLTVTLSGLNHSTTYYWQVRANNASGSTSADTNTWWSFTTSAGCPATINGWKGEYWDNWSWSGDPIVCRDDSDINFNWYSDSPDSLIPVDNFSAQWTKVVTFQAGPYTFMMVHDDGARLKIDGNVIIENLCYPDNCVATDYANYTPGAGTHTVVMQMRDNGGWSEAQLSWTSSSFAKTAPTNGATGISTTPTLSWGASSGATSYEYCYDTTNDNACSNWISAGTNTSVTLSGLNNGTTYYWQVRANGTSGATYADSSSTSYWSFTTSNPVPTITSLSPTSATVGGAAFTLTVNGTNFISSSIVRWNGNARTTTYVNATQLTAAITAADIATAGTIPVTVSNTSGTSNAVNFTVNNPVPTLSTLNPSSATAGGSAFTLTVNGTNFVNGSVVRWNGSARTTTYASATQLTVAIPAADIATAGTFPVTVFNPTPGGGTSGTVNLTVNNPIPTLSTLNPSLATAGGSAFTLNVTGANFVSSSVVRWNGSARTTTYVSTTQLTAAITASDIATAGTVPVTVFNSTPGGGTSGTVNFSVNNPIPTLSTLSPSSGISGGTAFTLAVNGTNFVNGSVVRWNGSARTTTYVSSTQLTAAITASDIATTGTFPVTVFNPTPGGGTSGAVNFIVTAPTCYALTTSISPSSSGSVSANPGSNCSGGKYNPGTVVQITANPSSGYSFVNWTGALTGSVNPVNVTMDSDKNVAANFIVSCGNCGVQNSAWPILRQNLLRTGRSPYNGPQNPVVKWSYVVGGYDGSAPAIGSDGTIYVGLGNDLYAITPSGTKIWNYTTGGAVKSPALSANGTIYIGSSDGKVYAINSNGTIKWSFTTGGWISASPAISTDGTLYIGSSDANLYAINYDGTLKWSYPVGSWLNSSPAIGSDGTIYFGSTTSLVYALNPNGTLKWSYQTGSYIDATPAIGSDGSVYIGSVDQYFYALDANGNLKWKYLTGGVANTPAAIAVDGTIYFGSGDGKLYAFQPNGSFKWSYLTQGSLNSVVIGADATLYAGSSDGNIYAINPNGSLKWSQPLSGAATMGSAIGSDGILYTVDTGTLYSIGDIPNPTITTLSPTSATAGGAAFTLTVNGTNFLNGSVVYWNGIAKTTAFVSATQLTATITAADIATAGTIPVTVANPVPGGTSNAVNFTVNALTSPNPMQEGSVVISGSQVVGGRVYFTVSIKNYGTSATHAIHPYIEGYANGTSFWRADGSQPGSAVIQPGQTVSFQDYQDVFVAGTWTASGIYLWDSDAGTFLMQLPSNGYDQHFSFTVNNPVPTLATLNPTSATAGGAAFTLTVNGSNFIGSSVVRWNGSDRTTTYVSATQLTVAITAADIASAGTFPVTVFNPTPGGGTSNAVSFTVNNPVPTLPTLSPSSATAGGAAFTLTVNGTNFVSSSVVQWNGSGRTTTFISSTQLTAVITAADIATAGTVPVAVLNPAPGGGLSYPAGFTVNNPVPTITTLSPSSATAGGAAFTLTVNGTNFVSGSVVRWNGIDHATTYISAAQLTAAITAADIASVATVPITVFNPTPGGGTSNAINFTVVTPNPVPTLTTLSPSSITIGGSAFTLTVNGTNFISSSIVRWNGNARTTTYVKATQLTASITVADIATAGSNPVTVFNPTPGGGTSNTVNFTVNNPVPTISTLNPPTTTAGGVAFTLIVNGSNFINGSVIRWNGSARTTTYISATQLTAAITAADIATSGTFPITIFNPAPGGGTSNAVNFAVNDSTITINTLSPSSATAGGTAFTLTVNGSGFLSSSVVKWNASARPTTYVSSTQLTASITAADIATAGTIPVTVSNTSGASNAVNFTINNPVPTITTLNPSSVTGGGTAFTLTVTGTNFVSSSVVRWNGADRTTTFVSATQVTAAIGAADIAASGTFPVTVFNPAPGGGVSNAVNFTVNIPVPTISTLNPTSVIVGGAAFTLTVNGTNFISSSVVRWNGANRTTTYVSATQLTASISAADIASTGTIPVTVFNPTPGGGTSNAVNFAINNAVPTVTTLNPTSAAPGGAAFTLTVNGTNFVSGSVVRWNGNARTTTFVSATQLTAAITAADIASATIVPVTVFNPTPGGGTSDVFNFTVGNTPSVVLAVLNPSTVTQGQNFDVTIEVRAGTQPVDGAAAYLNFDPTYLQVVSITPGTTLTTVLQNSYDNTAGQVNFSAGTFTNFPIGTFTLATITFHAQATTSSTALTFGIVSPRRSDVTFAGNSVLTSTEGGSLAITNLASINGSVTFQGRPTPPDARWVAPLTITLTKTGASQPAYSFTPTTDTSGHFSVSGIAPDTYEIRVKHSHTLRNLKTMTLAAGANAIDFGTLLEGDANDDGFVTLQDFSTLVTTYGKCQGISGYDPRDDFNMDTCVTLLDFSLLVTNYGKGGDMAVTSGINTEGNNQVTSAVSIRVDPPQSNVFVGDTFTVSILVQAGSQTADGAQVSLDFDPTKLQVKQITGNTTLLPQVLQNTYDNTKGTLDYAAGTFSNFPSGNFTLVQIEFQAIGKTAGTSLSFHQGAPRNTDITFGGNSVLTSHQDGTVKAENKNKIFIPMIIR